MDAASPERAITVQASATSKAPPSAVFALLKDGASWPEWTIFEAFELVRPGQPNGVGEIHVFSTALSRAREEIVELLPDRRFSYILLSGFPFKDYRADVELAPSGAGGTSILWRASFARRRVRYAPPSRCPTAVRSSFAPAACCPPTAPTA